MGRKYSQRKIVDYQAVKSLFENANMSYYAFYTKSQKLIKAMVRHLPQNTLSEGKSDGMLDLGFAVVSVKQTSTARLSPA
jgi:hypothetical protein